MLAIVWLLGNTPDSHLRCALICIPATARHEAIYDI